VGGDTRYDFKGHSAKQPRNKYQMMDMMGGTIQGLVCRSNPESITYQKTLFRIF
jgi:hypothetical protein